MTICFLIHDITNLGGTQRAQINLANALSARGETVSIWSCYGQRKTPAYPLASEVEVHHCMERPWPHFLDYPFLMLAFALYVFRRRPNWIVCTDTNRIIIAILAALLPGARVAVWEHFALAHSITKMRGRLARRLASLMADRIVTLTERDTKLYIEIYSPAGEVTCIPNIVTTPATRMVARRNEVLAVGRLTYQKGFDLLLEAWSMVSGHLPGWSLCIVGDGELRDQLVEQARRLGLDGSVRFAPFSSDPFSLYSECGIFVLSSRFEGLPFVLVEAMMCGSACISFDCPNGPQELIHHGVNGLLVPAEQVPLLAEAIVQLGRDADWRGRLGDSAMTISSMFSEQSVTARWQEVLRD